MKRINSKAVQYLGVDIHITMPFVAVDEDGSLHEYAKEPSLRGSEWQLDPSRDYNFICEVDLEGFLWENTLRRFEI